MKDKKTKFAKRAWVPTIEVLCFFLSGVSVGLGHFVFGFVLLSIGLAARFVDVLFK